jgi:fatty acid amide hydrolase
MATGPGGRGPVSGPAGLAGLADLTATELVDLLRGGAVSASQVVDAHIGRIEEVDPRLNAMAIPLFDQARVVAAGADRRDPDQRGPLHGLPVTVQECFDVVGTDSTAGVASRVGRPAGRDATLVARLRSAGAVILGKTNVAQLLLYAETDNPVYGRTNHPLDQTRSPGGSSGGEAALVAAGGSALGLGTDFGGGVRIPAHDCGLAGIRPTPGTLPMDGVATQGTLGGAELPDAAGLMGRSVDDLRLGLAALSPERFGEEATVEGDGRLAGVSPAAGLGGLRIGVYEDDGFFPASAAVRRAVREAVGTLIDQGADLEAVELPDVPGALGAYYGLLTADGGDALIAFLGRGKRDPRVADLLALGGGTGQRRPLLAGLGRGGSPHLPGVIGRVDEAGLRLLQMAAEDARARFARLLEERKLDALLGPVKSLPAFSHGATRDLGAASVNYTALYDLLRWPAGTVPVSRVLPGEESGRPSGRDRVLSAARKVDAGSAGLPVGVQVAALPGLDHVVLRVMTAIERGLPATRA